MSQFDNENDPNEKPRLSDGREQLGESLQRPVTREGRELGDSFIDKTAYDGPRVGDEFARTGDDRAVGKAFEDPNAYDDRKLGKAFDQATSEAKKPHKPLSEIVHKPSTTRFLWWFIIIAIILFLLLVVFGWLSRRDNNKQRDQRANSERNDLPEVEVIKVARAKTGTGLVVPGTTTPLVEAYVYGRANGYLKARLVDIGDHVHKGQLLAIIDAPDLDQQVEQAREQVNQAQAQLRQQQAQEALARITVERYRPLVAKGVFSRQDGDQREADYETSVANVASAERNVEAYKANLGHALALQSYERVTAPFDGVITQRNVDVGALISAAGSGGGNTPAPPSQPGTGTQAGATNSGGSSGSGASLATPSTGGAQGGALFSIAQTQRLRILVSVPEGYAGLVGLGQRATVFFQELPQGSFTGNVTRTADSIDQNSRTMLVEVQLDNHDGLLKSGMYAVVTFDPHGIPGQPSAAGPLVISGDAIAIRKDRPTVAVVGEDGVVKLTPVLIGRDYGSETEIIGGLKEGQTIAATFTDDVRDGVKIKPQADKNAQQKAAPQTTSQPLPPGGSTQYSDPGITDQDMQGQNAKPQQKGGGAKQPGGPQKKGSGDTGSKP